MAFLFCSQSKQFYWLNTQCVQFYWKGGDLVAFFFPNFLKKIGTFLLFWQYVWMLNFFFLLNKISFFTYLAKFHFFLNSAYIRVFNFRKIFEGKSYIRLIIKSAYIREYIVFNILFHFKMLTEIYTLKNIILLTFLTKQLFAFILLKKNLHFSIKRMR